MNELVLIAKNIFMLLFWICGSMALIYIIVGTILDSRHINKNKRTIKKY